MRCHHPSSGGRATAQFFSLTGLRSAFAIPGGNCMVASNTAETLLQLAAGYWVPRCLHAVANLGVADALEDTPQTAAALADAIGADPEALNRVLRLLSAYGVFEYRDGLVAHSPASRLLRADHPRSMRSLARMCGLSALWDAVGELEYSI